MPKAFLETGQEALLVPGFDVEHTGGIQPGLLESRSEEVRTGHTPENLTGQSRGNTRSEEGGNGTIYGSIAAARDLMQGTARQSALGQGRIQSLDAEGQNAARAATGLLKPIDLDAESFET